jgi:predicted PhzF superfamily epimerase YddE/YHI9
MRLPIWQIDAFTKGPFGGNPAAIVRVEDWLPVELMQAIAAENNQTTTAFLRRDDSGFALRWFTPTIEEPVCGHATLAAGALVLDELDPKRDAVTFETRAGPLTVARAGEGMLEIDLAQREVLAGRDYLVICESAAELGAIHPDGSALALLDRHAVIVTAPGENGFDCVSRFFAPGHGIAEDHATGAAHMTVAPYWSARLGRDVLLAEQASARGGVFRCTLRPDGRLVLAGRCAFYMRGEIAV